MLKKEFSQENKKSKREKLQILTSIVTQVFLIVCFICTSSCVHKSTSKRADRFENCKANSDIVDIDYDNLYNYYNLYPLFTDEARLLDIPFPINVTLFNLQNKEDKRKVALIYIVDQSVNSIIAFYRTEMECLGWHEKAKIKAIHAGIIFEKHSKICLITVKSINYKSSEVTLFVAPNKYIS